MLHYAFPKIYEDIIFCNTLTGIYLLKVKNRNIKTRWARLGNMINFCADKFLWICWKRWSPWKLIHTQINLAKVYHLKIKKTHNIEKASCRSSTKMHFAKRYYMQHFWSSNESVLRSAFVLINLAKCLWKSSIFSIVAVLSYWETNYY